MSGRSNDDIREQINAMIKVLDEAKPYGDEEVWYTHNLDNDVDPERCVDLKNEPLLYLSSAIKKMAFCDAVAFGIGWYEARGCRIEYNIAKEYGLDIIHKKDGKIVVN